MPADFFVAVLVVGAFSIFAIDLAGACISASLNPRRTTTPRSKSYPSLGNLDHQKGRLA